MKSIRTGSNTGNNAKPGGGILTYSPLPSSPVALSLATVHYFIYFLICQQNHSFAFHVNKCNPGIIRWPIPFHLFTPCSHPPTHMGQILWMFTFLSNNGVVFSSRRMLHLLHSASKGIWRHFNAGFGPTADKWRKKSTRRWFAEKPSLSLPFPKISQTTRMLIHCSCQIRPTGGLLKGQ